MSYKFAMMAIKTEDVDRVLETVADFYKQYKLELKEVGFGETQSSYVDDIKYPTYMDFVKDADAIIYKNNIENSNTFGLHYNLGVNKDWIVLMYSPHIAKFPLNIDVNLSRMLSEDLQVEVLEYMLNETTGTVVIRYNKNNSIKDYFVQVGGKQFLSKGVFENTKDQELDSFFKEVQFDPYAEEIIDFRKPHQWRSFYLDGSDENLKQYTEKTQETI